MPKPVSGQKEQPKRPRTYQEMYHRNNTGPRSPVFGVVCQDRPASQRSSLRIGRGLASDERPAQDGNAGISMATTGSTPEQRVPGRVAESSVQDSYANYTCPGFHIQPKPVKLTKEKIYVKKTSSRTRHNRPEQQVPTQVSQIQKARQTYAKLTRGKGGVDISRGQDGVRKAEASPTVSTMSETPFGSMESQTVSGNPALAQFSQSQDMSLAGNGSYQSGGLAHYEDTTNNNQSSDDHLAQPPLIPASELRSAVVRAGQRRASRQDTSTTASRESMHYLGTNAKKPELKASGEFLVTRSMKSMVDVNKVKSANSVPVCFAPAILARNLGFGFMDPFNPAKGLRGDFVLKNLSNENYTYRMSTSAPHLLEVEPCTVGVIKAWREKVVTFKTKKTVIDGRAPGLAEYVEQKYYLEAAELWDGCKSFSEVANYWKSEPFGSKDFVCEGRMTVEPSCITPCSSSTSTTLGLANTKSMVTSKSSLQMMNTKAGRRVSTESTEGVGRTRTGLCSSGFCFYLLIFLLASLCATLGGYFYYFY